MKTHIDTIENLNLEVEVEEAAEEPVAEPPQDPREAAVKVAVIVVLDLAQAPAILAQEEVDTMASRQVAAEVLTRDTPPTPVIRPITCCTSIISNQITSPPLGTILQLTPRNTLMDMDTTFIMAKKVITKTLPTMYYKRLAPVVWCGWHSGSHLVSVSYAAAATTVAKLRRASEIGTTIESVKMKEKSGSQSDLRDQT
jgi:hypothetical protein